MQPATASAKGSTAGSLRRKQGHEETVKYRAYSKEGDSLLFTKVTTNES